MLPAAAPALRRKLLEPCSLEVRARIEAILQPDQPAPLGIGGDERVRAAWALAMLADCPQDVAVLCSIANLSGCLQVREIARMAAVRNCPTAVIDADPGTVNH